MDNNPTETKTEPTTPVAEDTVVETAPAASSDQTPPPTESTPPVPNEETPAPPEASLPPDIAAATTEVPVDEAAPVAHGPKPQISAPIFVSKSTAFPELVASLGLASLFLVYAIATYLHPDALQQVVTSNPIGKSIGHTQLIVEVSQFINLFLGLLILLFNRWKVTIYAWAGVWLLAIAALKLANLFM